MSVFTSPRHGRGINDLNHFCARCGQCLCDCKDCAVFYPCCCRACWEATAPRPPVTTTHDCTCAPKAVTA